MAITEPACDDLHTCDGPARGWPRHTYVEIGAGPDSIRSWSRARIRERGDLARRSWRQLAENLLKSRYFSVVEPRELLDPIDSSVIDALMIIVAVITASAAVIFPTKTATGRRIKSAKLFSSCPHPVPGLRAGRSAGRTRRGHSSIAQSRARWRPAHRTGRGVKKALEMTLQRTGRTGGGASDFKLTAKRGESRLTYG